MAASIYWYDFETTGTDPIHDRAIQFAGVRTDLELNEVAPPQNFLGRPGNDVIPSPDAMLVTGIRMSDLLEQGMNERDFADHVMEQFLVPETCVAGFNSIRFDDEFTRQMLYRNLQDPYAREWRSGNSRWDVIDLFRAAQALRPDGLNWPKRDDGSPVFRLEALAEANNVPHSDAHDALADVRVTVEMTRRLRLAQPKLFDYMFRLRDKKAVVAQLYPLGKTPVLHVSSMYPASRQCIAVVLPVCQHPTNGNAILCFDLAMDPEVLLEATPMELQRLVFTRTEDLEEGESRVALKTIHINRCPFVAPMSTLAAPDAERLGIDRGACEATAGRLIGAPGLVEKIQEVFSRNPFDDPEDPDEMLYSGGFFSEADRNSMTAVLETPAQDMKQFEGRFQDDRLDEMLFRFRARNYPEHLSPEEAARWAAHRQSRFDGRLGAVMDDVTKRINASDGDDRDVLEDLLQYLQVHLRETVSQS